MDIHRLRYFTVIAKTGSLTEAAKVLHISQAALSKAMTIFESEIGIAVFHHVGRGIALTDEGRQVLPRIEKILLEIETLKGGGEIRPAAESCLRVGSFEVFSTYFLQPLICKAFPELELELHELLPGELETSIVEERLDIGITYIPVPMAGLDFMKVGQVKMAVYGRSQFLKDPDLKNLPFVVPILPVHGAPTKVNGLDGWPDDKVPRYQKYRVTLMESAMQLCRNGMCVAYLPSFVAELHNLQVLKSYNLVEIPITKVPQFHQDVFLVKRRATKEDERIKRIARVIRSTCRL